MNTAAPLSGKVTVGTLSGSAVGMTTAVLIAAIPAWHNGLPGWVSYLIPVAVMAAGHFVGGYLAKHRISVGEVTTALADASAIIQVVNHAAIKNAPPVGKTSPAGGAHE